ncbi:ATP-dependent helicase HrpB [Rhodobacteraceae bacterium]|nr:ATP-dependent helicase HrpB [Paracoccaceae bacterium]
MKDDLPIYDVLDTFLTALRAEGRVVLSAPPGAGKTTVIPLAILQSAQFTGKIIMLEPRRLAAKGAAARMADSLGEVIGDTVGYRIRGDAKTSSKTRIEVVTEGILTRMIQSDPELAGVDCIIFDEFHERSLNADLGLALALEIADALRDDLRLVVMSATLDADPIATLLGDAPIVTSQGRAFDVTPIWLDRPLAKEMRFETAMADLITTAAQTSQGGILAFCPGEGEIRRVQAALAHRLPSDCQIMPLYGAMEFADQQRAIAPLPHGRKVVLATSIAETSLTIADIRVVVDGGLARRARFSPATGMSQLITERASKAEATQRMGRAGRVAHGTCFKLWSKAEEGIMPAFAPAEIETADLASFALEVAQWGSDAAHMKLLTPPNAALLAEARALLVMLGALDGHHRITEHGKTLVRAPVHPRLAHMLALGGATAAPLAALLSDRDILDRGAPSDFTLRINALKDLRAFQNQSPHSVNRATYDRVKSDAQRLAKRFDHVTNHSVAQVLALAFPDRIGQRRKGDDARFVLSGGKGAILDNTDPLGAARFIVAIELDGNPREARIRQAIQISEPEIREIFSDHITQEASCAWSKRDRRVVAQIRECFGQIALKDTRWKDAPDDVIARAMLGGVRDLGFAWSPAEQRFLSRVRLLADRMPPMSDEDLMAGIEDWLLPYLSRVSTAEDWKKFNCLDALRAILSWDDMQTLDTAAPAHFTTPLNRSIPIDYDGDYPSIELRLQEMFGQTTHPHVGKTPLRITLLSPAGRPVQTTTDLVGFWDNSYADVRKDMRGRYPKHPWPEDPRQADPTLRAKPRG